MSSDVNTPAKVEGSQRVGLLERAIDWVAPGWARSRQIARMHLTELRKYDAVKNTRLRRKREDHRDADSINNESVVRMRAQARHLEENSDQANSVINTILAGVVGDGIRTVPMAKRRDGTLADRFNRRITELLRDWARRPEVTWEHDWPSLQALDARAWIRDGETLSQMLMGVNRRLDHGSLVPFSLESLEADMVPVDFTDRDRRIIQGVEKDTWGRAKAFHVYRDHPGDALVTFGNLSTDVAARFWALGETKRVPADRMVHLKMVKRVRQTRGVPLFAPVFTRLQDLKDFEESERVAARIAAAFAFAITKSPDYAGSTTGLTTGQLREIGITPGIMVDGLQPGEKVESIKNERPNNALLDFRKAMLQAVAGGTGASYSSVARDYAGSYSSQRQELIESALLYAIMRSRFIGSYVDRIYRNFVDMAVLSGLVSTAGVDPETLHDVEHRGHGVPYIDPQKEINADLIGIQAGLYSKTGTILRRGGDPEQTREQIKREREQDSLDGLIFSSDWANAGGGSSTGMVDAATGGEEEEEAKTGGEDPGEGGEEDASGEDGEQ